MNDFVLNEVLDVTGRPGDFGAGAIGGMFGAPMEIAEPLARTALNMTANPHNADVPPLVPRREGGPVFGVNHITEKMGGDPDTVLGIAGQVAGGSVSAGSLGRRSAAQIDDNLERARGSDAFIRAARNEKHDRASEILGRYYPTPLGLRVGTGNAFGMSTPSRYPFRDMPGDARQALEAQLRTITARGYGEAALRFPGITKEEYDLLVEMLDEIGRVDRYGR